MTKKEEINMLFPDLTDRSNVNILIKIAKKEVIEEDYIVLLKTIVAIDSYQGDYKAKFIELKRCIRSIVKTGYKKYKLK